MGSNMSSSPVENVSIIWMAEAFAAFEMLKSDLCSTLALVGPDYSKPFHLYVSEKQGLVNAV